jgi:hypothetical protein
MRGEARVMIEKALLGDALNLEGVSKNMLDALRELLADGFGLRSKCCARRSQTGVCSRAVRLKHITRAANSHLYVVYIQFFMIRIFSQPTPVLDEAINWHLAFKEWELQARKVAMEKQWCGTDTFKSVTEPGFMLVLKSQPSLRPSFQLMNSTFQRYNAPRTPDFRQCIRFHRDYHMVCCSGGDIGKIKERLIRERDSTKLQRQQRYHDLVKAVGLEIERRAQTPALMSNRLNWDRLGMSRPRLVTPEQSSALCLGPSVRSTIVQPSHTKDAILRFMQGALHLSADDVKDALPRLWAIPASEVRRRWSQLIRPTRGLTISNVQGQVFTRLDRGLKRRRTGGERKCDVRSLISCQSSWLSGMPIDIAVQVSNWITIEELVRIRYCASRFAFGINAMIAGRLEMGGFFRCNPESELFHHRPKHSFHGRPLRQPAVMPDGTYRLTHLRQSLSKGVVHHILAFLQNRNFIDRFRQLDLSAIPAPILENFDFHCALQNMSGLFSLVLPKHGWSDFAQRNKLGKYLGHEVDVIFV